MSKFLENVSKEDISSIFEVIPLEVLLSMRDVFRAWRANKAHGRFEVSVKDGKPSTWHETNSHRIESRK